MLPQAPVATRINSGAADLAAIDSDLIGYAQLNDTTLKPRMDNYMEEAMFERMVPGEADPSPTRGSDPIESGHDDDSGNE